MRPLTSWNCGFESRRGYGRLSLVSLVCCKVEVSATSRSLVQRSPIECGVSGCDRETSIMRSWPEVLCLSRSARAFVLLFLSVHCGAQSRRKYAISEMNCCCCNEHIN